MESFRENLLIKSRNQNIFEKFQLNRNLQTIPFKMMYNMFILCHWFSNEQWGGGAEPGLPLLGKCHFLPGGAFGNFSSFGNF